MAAFDPFNVASNDLANGSDLTVDGTSGGTGAIEIHSIAHGGACDCEPPADGKT